MRIYIRLNKSQSVNRRVSYGCALDGIEHQFVNHTRHTHIFMLSRRGLSHAADQRVHSSNKIYSASLVKCNRRAHSNCPPGKQLKRNLAPLINNNLCRLHTHSSSTVRAHILAPGYIESAKNSPCSRLDSMCILATIYKTQPKPVKKSQYEINSNHA